MTVIDIRANRIYKCYCLYYFFFSKISIARACSSPGIHSLHCAEELVPEKGPCQDHAAHPSPDTWSSRSYLPQRTVRASPESFPFVAHTRTSLQPSIVTNETAVIMPLHHRLAVLPRWTSTNGAMEHETRHVGTAHIVHGQQRP